jgi:hypothetical protein
VVTLNVLYKATLSDVGGLIYGRTTDQAVNVKIYAVYYDGSKDVSVPLNVKIQDCACCGAYVAAGVWKNFMCHNLGADQTLDPTVAANGLIGNYYFYGQKVSTKEGGNNFIQGTAWARNAANPLKGASDPCPSGYRVPTAAELTGVANTAINTFTKLGTWGSTSSSLSAIAKFGERLHLPIGGYYQGTSVYGVNSTAWYLAADGLSSSNAATIMGISTSSPSVNVQYLTLTGAFSVRCIEQ